MLKPSVPLAEAARRLGVSTTRTKTLVRSGKLEGGKVGGRWLVTEASLTARIRALPLPPGSERRLYTCRLLAALTTFRDRPGHRGWGRPVAFFWLEQRWFGRPETAMFREPIRSAAEAALAAGRRRDVAALREAFAALDAVLVEHQEVRAKLDADYGRS